MILVVAPPVNEVVQEHMVLCQALRLPFFVVVTKVDLGYCKPRDIISQLEIIARMSDCNYNFDFYDQCSCKRWKRDFNFIPVFPVSCVSGEGVKSLIHFIKDLLPLESAKSDSSRNSCLFQIDEMFRYGFYHILQLYLIE